MKKSLFLFLIILSIFSSCSTKEKDRYYDKDGFSIKFPANWIIETNKNNVSVIASDPSSNYMNFKSNINIVVKPLIESEKDLSLQQMLDLTINKFHEMATDLKISEKGITKADSKNQGFFFTVSNNNNSKIIFSKFNFYIKNKKVYAITFTVDEKEYGKTKTLYSKSLNSFRFE